MLLGAVLLFPLKPANIRGMIELVILLGVVGAAIGSFVDALVWRLHTNRNFISGRSECEHCHHKLGALDMIPIVSWLILGGKCRYCRKPIAKLAPLTEVTLAALFVISYMFWPLGFEHWPAVASFGLWLVFLVMLAALFVYDLRWMLLPDKIVLPLICLGLIDAGLRVSLTESPGFSNYLVHISLGAVVLGGLYWLLHLVSKGAWVGFGDVKLGIFMGAVLGWQGALLTLVLANLIGFAIVVPGLLLAKLTRKSRVPFGPFLIAGFIVTALFGQRIIDWYLSTFVLIM